MTELRRRLQEYGGIYLDIDTVILKPFRDASIMMQDTVLGMEAKHLSISHGKASDNTMDPKGLCNAIIVARPQSIFVKRWLDSYEEFDNRQWADHSVVSRCSNHARDTLLISLFPSANTVDPCPIVSNYSHRPL